MSNRTLRFLPLLVLLFTLSVSSIPTRAFSASKLGDDEFLDMLERKAFDYFWKETHTATGLVRDRALNWGTDESKIASTAAAGFALTAYPIGIERGWISREEGYQRTLRTLQFFSKSMESQHGFFYHFVDRVRGSRVTDSEVSSIDTALFLMGALFAGEYFKGTSVELRAQELYKRVNFRWMLNRGRTLSMGWKPEGGFLPSRWENYDEGLLLYLLAVGSPTHPIPASSWNCIRRKVGRYQQWTVIASPPLFTHQYPQLWLDLRNQHDAYADYFRNSTDATLANRQFCIDQSGKYPTYSPNVWGLSACEGQRGYRAYGASPGPVVQDGTVTPYAAAGSIIFTPRESVNLLRYLYENHKTFMWGKYGFSDAFTLKPPWRSSHCYGIDEGALLLAVENYRSGFVWKIMKRQKDLQRALSKVGFKPGTKTLQLLQAPVFSSQKLSHPIQLDGRLTDWGTPAFSFSNRELEFGTITNEKDFLAKVYSAWDEQWLYFAVDITDQELVAHRGQAALFKDDAVEIFVDPEQNGFEWTNPKDFQFIFSPRLDGSIKAWEAIHKVDPFDAGWSKSTVRLHPGGYTLELAISFKAVHVQPKAGERLRLSVAVHDVDREAPQSLKNPWLVGKELKMNTFFQESGPTGQHELAVFTLE